jgi:hypothetical protein
MSILTKKVLFRIIEQIFLKNLIWINKVLIIQKNNLDKKGKISPNTSIPTNYILFGILEQTFLKNRIWTKKVGFVSLP